MDKMNRAFYLLAHYMLVLLAMAGYWIEMAEELEAGSLVAKLGKGVLIVVKLVVIPR